MAENKRSILIAHYRPDIVSGAENSIADLVEQIDPRFHITMLVPGEGSLADFYRKRGFEVWVKQVQSPRRLLPGLHQAQSIFFARELKRRQVDAVLCNTFPSTSRVATACRIAGIPYAIYMRDYIPDTPLHRRILSRASALYAISRDVIEQHAGMADPALFRLAYNYIHPDPILKRHEAHQASGKRLLPYPAENPVVGLVGRITPYKQPDLFLRAIPHVLKAVPEARFVLIGAAQQREKPFEETVRSLAGTLGIADQVRFLGQRRDAVELTSEFTIAALASGREPLGRVILEAHLLGIPVVVPNTGGPAEIVENDVTGLHFDSTAPDADVRMAEQMVRLLRDANFRECLARQARERIHNTFASHKHVGIQEQYIDELCETRQRK